MIYPTWKEHVALLKSKGLYPEMVDHNGDGILKPFRIKEKQYNKEVLECQQADIRLAATKTGPETQSTQANWRKLVEAVI